DLDRDLAEGTLARYRAEAVAAERAGQEGHVLVLESTNLWPLGLVGYWRRGSVRAMEMPGGVEYLVSESRGYGPLSVLYVSGDEAAFSADGVRLRGSASASLLWGHLAMFHSMDSGGAGSARHRHDSAHLLHHFLNWSTEHAGTSFWLFSAPNPVGAGQQ
ncbi:MAG: hypothetical protein ACYS1C_03305, partial [Planctomycetota bacterium]